jgi:uncharacterized membrane protein YqjE
MAQTLAAANSRATESELENLPTLISRLGSQVTELLDTQIDLLKTEVREEALVYVHGGAMVALGALVAAVGFALVNVAGALLVSFFFARYGMSTAASYAAGFATTGLFYLIVGGGIAMVMKNRLARHNPAPTRTIEELRKDKQWLKKEL